MAKASIPECIICYRESPETPAATPCGHIFCRSCISTALQMNRHCPMCRKRVAVKALVNIIATESVVEEGDSDEGTNEKPRTKLQMKCVKCLKAPNSPELANCGHVFCHSCANLWYESPLRCPSHDRAVDRRHLYKLFCDGINCKSAASPRASSKLPRLPLVETTTVTSSRQQQSNSSSNTSYDDDFDSDSDSTSDSDDDDEIERINNDDVILINRFVLALPQTLQNSHQNNSSGNNHGNRGNNSNDHHEMPTFLAPPSFALIQRFGRHPLILMQHSFLPRLTSNAATTTQSGSNNDGGEQSQQQQNGSSRRSFLF